MPFPERDSNWNEQHPDEGMLHEWLDEQLDTDAAARIAAHVSACDVCRARVAEARGLIAASRRILGALDDVPGNVIPDANATRGARDHSRTDNDSGVLPFVAAAKSVAPDVHRVAAVAPMGATAANATTHGSVSPSLSTSNTAPRNDTFRWRRWGSIAAVLVLGATGYFVVNRNHGATITTVRSNAAPQVAVSEMRPDARKEIAEGDSLPSTPATNGAFHVDTNAAAGAASMARRAPQALRSEAIAGAQAMPARDSSGLRTAQPMATNASVPLELEKKSAPASAVVTAGDTLAQRLETERSRRAQSETVAADQARRPRIDAIVPAPPMKSMTERAIGTTSSTIPAGAMPRLAFGPIAFDSLVLKREPCFGRCPSYELFVNSSGHVRYRSQHREDSRQEQTAQLASDARSQLHAAIERAQIDSLKSYMPDLPSCGPVATDMPTLHLTVFRQSREFKLDQYQGCSLATQAIPALMREIDAIVGTERWLPAGYRLN